MLRLRRYGENRSKIGILKAGGSVCAKFPCSRGRHPPIIFAQIVRPTNALQLCRWVFTQRNFVEDYLQAKCDFTWKTAILRFWASFGGLGATYDVHLMLTVKHTVDFLLVLTELFFASCYSWGAIRDYRFKISDFAPMGAGWPDRISGRRGRPHQPKLQCPKFEQ